MMTLDDLLTDSDDEMDNTGIGDSYSVDGSVGSVLSESEVETLLTEKLIQGFVLQPTCCPTCNTPLVKAMTNMPIPVEEDDGDGAGKTVPINGVPFCVSCCAHVMTTKEEIRIMTEKNALLGGSGAVLLAMSEDEESDDEDFVPRIVPQPLSMVLTEPADSNYTGASAKVLEPMSQHISEPMSEPMSKPVSQPVSRPTSASQPIAEPVSRPTSASQPISEPSVVQEVEEINDYFPAAPPLSEPIYQPASQLISEPMSPNQPASHLISEPMSPTSRLQEVEVDEYFTLTQPKTVDSVLIETAHDYPPPAPPLAMQASYISSPGSLPISQPRSAFASESISEFIPQPVQEPIVASEIAIGSTDHLEEKIESPAMLLQPNEPFSPLSPVSPSPAEYLLPDGSSQPEPSTNRTLSAVSTEVDDPIYTPAQPDISGISAIFAPEEVTPGPNPPPAMAPPVEDPEAPVTEDDYEKRRLVATKILGAKMLQGFTLRETQCDVCSMPIMQKPNSPDLMCVVCPVLAKKARKKEKRERAQQMQLEAERAQQMQMEAEKEKQIQLLEAAQAQQKLQLMVEQGHLKQKLNIERAHLESEREKAQLMQLQAERAKETMQMTVEQVEQKNTAGGRASAVGS